MNALWKNTVLLTIVLSLLSAQFGCKPKETVNPSNFKVAEWEQEIRNPSLTAANFTKLYIQLVTANITNAQVAVLSPLEITVTITNGGKWKLNLDNLWTEASGNPDGRPEACRHHLNAIAGFVSGRSGGMAETNSVVPTIKDDVFLNQIPAGLEHFLFR